jgi:UDP-glucose 4-epimerase
MEKIVIVTGGAGYIGSHTVVELFLAGYTPIIIDDFRNSKPWILDRIAQIVEKKITAHLIDCQNEIAFNEVLSTYKAIYGIIHFAADKAVGESVDQPIKYYQNNIGSLCVVLNALKKFGIKNFVFSSSCTVYGETLTPIVTEESPIMPPASPYGDTKIIGERIIQNYWKTTSDAKIMLLRYFNPIGAHPSALIGELPQGIPNNLVPYITQTAKGKRESLTVFGGDYNTPDGTAIRDYIHVSDLAIAHVKALTYLEKTSAKLFDYLNIGSGKGTSVLELIKTFEEVNQLKLNYQIGNRRPGDVEQIFANADKAKKTIDWTCKFSLKDALLHAWEWEKSLPV